MVGIPSRPDLQFDLFDALGLDPATPITPSVIQKAWRRVNLQIHPDKTVAATYIPAFPTYPQARQAKDYLLAEEKRATDAQTCIQTALAHGRAGYRSTWNPWATPNTAAVLKPIPDAPAVDSGDGPARKKQSRTDGYVTDHDVYFGSFWDTPGVHRHERGCECGSCVGQRWASEWREEREEQNRHERERERAEEEEERERHERFARDKDRAEAEDEREYRDWFASAGRRAGNSYTRWEEEWEEPKRGSTRKESEAEEAARKHDEKHAELYGSYWREFYSWAETGFPDCRPSNRYGRRGEEREEPKRNSSDKENAPEEEARENQEWFKRARHG
ncbi:Cyclin-dependent kinase 11A [Xylographa bjoerkii]|nr:Cyclin-dependent kinase 11A [Xylographa bjoerkii]